MKEIPAATHSCNVLFGDPFSPKYVQADGDVLPSARSYPEGQHVRSLVSSNFISRNNLKAL